MTKKLLNLIMEIFRIMFINVRLAIFGASLLNENPSIK